MRRFRISCGAVACLLVAALQSPPAQAAGAESRMGFSLRVHGGFSYLLAVDVNTGSRGGLDSYSTWVTEGRYRPIHGGYDFGADFVIQLSPRFGAGIGFGYIQSSENSRLEVLGIAAGALQKSKNLMLEIGGVYPRTLISEPKLSAMPIRLGVFTTWPLGGKWNLTVNGGAAFYAAVKFGLVQGLEVLSPEAWRETIRAKMNRPGNIGFQGGLGLEYALAPRMFLFFEAMGRYARLKNFNSATGVFEGEMGSFEEAGKIYLRTYASAQYSTIILSDTEPMPGPDVTYREPKFDFSGFALQVGFRVKL